MHRWRNMVALLSWVFVAILSCSFCQCTQVWSYCWMNVLDGHGLPDLWYVVMLANTHYASDLEWEQPGNDGRLALFPVSLRSLRTRPSRFRD